MGNPIFSEDEVKAEADKLAAKDAAERIDSGLPSPDALGKLRTDAAEADDADDRAAFDKIMDGPAASDAPADDDETTPDADPGDGGDSAAEDLALSDELRAALLRDNWKNTAIEALLSTDGGAADLIETATKAKARQAEEQRVFDRLRALEKTEGTTEKAEEPGQGEPSVLDALEPVFDELTDEAGSALKRAFEAQEARIAQLSRDRAQDAKRAQAAEQQAVKAQVDATRQELSGVYPEFQDPNEWEGIFTEAQLIAKSNDTLSVPEVFERAARYLYGKRSAPKGQAKKRQSRANNTPTVSGTSPSNRPKQALTQEQQDRAAFDEIQRQGKAGVRDLARVRRAAGQT